MNETIQPLSVCTDAPRAEEFCARFADVPVRVRALFGSTRAYCEDYLTDETPVLEVSLDGADLLNERRINAAMKRENGRDPLSCPDEYMERLALLRKVSERLVYHGVLLFHGCAVAVGGKAYLFTAKAGTGKTTHGRLWAEHIPGCHILTGDKPFLLFRDGKVFVCGTPWRGKERYGTNEVLPLAGICILERDSENHIERVSFDDAFPVLMKQCNIPKGAGAAGALRLLAMMKNAALYRLGCNMNEDAAWVSYRGI